MLKQKRIRGLNTAWIQKGPTDGGGGSGKERPILLFLHGCPDSPDVWNLQIEYFAKSYTVIAPYARGIGLSQAPLSPSDVGRYGLDAAALDYLEILRTVDPTQKRRVCVIGHDLGGPQAWHLAPLLGKERLLGLVSITGPSLYQMALRIKNPRQLLKSWYIGFFQIPKISDLIVQRRDRKFVEEARRAGERPEGAGSAGAVKPFLNQYRQIFRALPKTWMNPPPRISSPVLVIWGRRDAFLEVPSEAEMKKLAEHYTIRVMDANHWPQLEASEKVNHYIDEFIQSQTP